MLKKAVESENEKELVKYLDFRRTNKIDSSHNVLIEKALLGTWHSNTKT